MSNAFEKFQTGLQKVVGPFANKVGSSKYIKALTEGFMCTMPITLGVAAIAVLSNLPIAPWVSFLKSTGLYQTGQDVVALTLSLIAIYVVGAIGYCFTRDLKENGIVGAIIATASFIVLIPIQTFNTKAGAVTALVTKFMGSDGIFVAILIGLFIPRLYCYLMSKNLQLKLPDTVPPMVSKSLTPTFVSMIIFTMLFFVKYACTFTPYGNLFTMIATLIGQPITKLGASPLSLIIVYTAMNLVWFFGIHPNTILIPYMPVLMAAGTANTEAYLAGKTLPFYAFAIVSTCVYVGGSGNTLGLCLATLFAKSDKYKAMRKLVIPANIFNINEPVIFGFPLVLNPIYLLPMVLSSLVTGFIGWIAVRILPIQFNPTISMPWVTPGFVTAFFAGGIWLFLLWILCLLVHFIMYLPFFLIDDKNALEAEKANAATQVA